MDNNINIFNSAVKKIVSRRNDLIKQFTVDSPSLAYMYGTVKMHKEGNPLRPIISTVGTVSYKLSKWLVKLLSPLLGTASGSHIKSDDLIIKLNDVNVTADIRLLSFDVMSLFSKVPIGDIIKKMSDHFSQFQL